MTFDECQTLNCLQPATNCTQHNKLLFFTFTRTILIHFSILICLTDFKEAIDTILFPLFEQNIDKATKSTFHVDYSQTIRAIISGQHMNRLSNLSCQTSFNFST